MIVMRPLSIALMLWAVSTGSTAQPADTLPRQMITGADWAELMWQDVKTICKVEAEAVTDAFGDDGFIDFFETKLTTLSEHLQETGEQPWVEPPPRVNQLLASKYVLNAAHLGIMSFTMFVGEGPPLVTDDEVRDEQLMRLRTRASMDLAVCLEPSADDADAANDPAVSATNVLGFWKTARCIHILEAAEQIFAIPIYELTREERYKAGLKVAGDQYYATEAMKVSNPECED